jgi:hypothetical protein
VKIAVAPKAIDTFKQRIRLITRRIGGRSMTQVAEQLRQYLPGWKAYFCLAGHRRRSKTWNHGCVVAFGRSSSSNGDADARFIVLYVSSALLKSWPHEWRAQETVGGTVVFPTCTVSSR